MTITDEKRIKPVQLELMWKCGQAVSEKATMSREDIHTEMLFLYGEVVDAHLRKDHTCTIKVGSSRSR